MFFFPLHASFCFLCLYGLKQYRICWLYFMSEIVGERHSFDTLNGDGLLCKIMFRSNGSAVTERNPLRVRERFAALVIWSDRKRNQ